MDEAEAVDVRTPAELEACLRLRHQVYVEERGWLPPGRGGLETDQYDPHSAHVLVRAKRCGTPVGTVRLVLPGPHGFPLQSAVPAGTLGPVPLWHAGEISRFALARQRPPLSAAANALLRLLLVQGVIALCRKNRLHWCVMAMERPLLRLLRGSGIHCTAAGPEVDYHGMRQPAYFRVRDMLARMATEQPALHALVSTPLPDGSDDAHHPGDGRAAATCFQHRHVSIAKLRTKRMLAACSRYSTKMEVGADEGNQEVGAY